MARVQYGTIVTEIKGKVQGQVLQGGNVGFVLRNKGYTKGISSTPRQTANRNLSANAAAWRGLSDANRTAWGAIAADWIFYNRFGAAYEGNGYQIYNSYNGNRLNLELSRATTPGAVNSPVNPDFQDFTFDLPSTCRYDRGNPGGTNDYMNFFATAPYSPGRNNNHLRFTKIAFSSINGIDTADLLDEYQAVFPMPVAGQKVSLRVISYNALFPYPFYDQIITAIVTA